MYNTDYISSLSIICWYLREIIQNLKVMKCYTNN